MRGVNFDTEGQGVRSYHLGGYVRTTLALLGVLAAGVGVTVGSAVVIVLGCGLLGLPAVLGSGHREIPAPPRDEPWTARARYLRGEIEVDEFERLLERELQGGYWTVNARGYRVFRTARSAGSGHLTYDA